ncbi:MAG: hypothetical protein WC091_14105 [Sulfuricellaceae bacterium]
MSSIHDGGVSVNADFYRYWTSAPVVLAPRKRHRRASVVSG